MSVDRLLQLDRVRHNQIDAEKAQLNKIEHDLRLLRNFTDTRTKQRHDLHTLQERVRKARVDLLPRTRKRVKLAATVLAAANDPSVPLPTGLKKHPTGTGVTGRRNRRKPKAYTFDDLSGEVTDCLDQVADCEGGEPARSLYAKLEGHNQVITSCMAHIDGELTLLNAATDSLQQRLNDIADNRLQTEYFAMSTAHVAAALELQRKFQHEVERIQAALRFGVITTDQRKALYKEYEALYSKFTKASDDLLHLYAKDTGTDLSNNSTTWTRQRPVRVFHDKNNLEYVRCVDGSCLRLSAQNINTTPELQKASTQALKTYEDAIGNDPLTAMGGTGGSNRSARKKKHYRKSLEASVDKKLRDLQGSLGNAAAMDDMLGNIESFMAGGPIENRSTTAANTTVTQQETAKVARDELHRELTAIFTVEHRGAKNPYIYKKENHMRDLLNAVQGKCQSILPSEVLEEVRKELRKYGSSFNYETLFPTRVRKILSDRGMTNFYDHAWYITSVLNPKYRLCSFDKQHEERILQRFCALEKPFEQLKTVVVTERRNMMSYPFTAFKICELEEFLCEHALEQRQRDLERFKQQPPDKELVVESVYAHCQDGYEILTRGVGATHIPFRERYDPVSHCMVHVLRVGDCCAWLETRIAFLQQEMQSWRDYRPYFKFLKDGKLMKKQDRWWRLCCEELRWPQIKTVGNESFSFVPKAKPWKYDTRPISPRRVAAYNAKFSFRSGSKQPSDPSVTTTATTVPDPYIPLVMEGGGMADVDAVDAASDADMELGEEGDDAGLAMMDETN